MIIGWQIIPAQNRISYHNNLTYPLQYWVQWPTTYSMTRYTRVLDSYCTLIVTEQQSNRAVTYIDYIPPPLFVCLLYNNIYYRKGRPRGVFQILFDKIGGNSVILFIQVQNIWKVYLVVYHNTPYLNDKPTIKLSVIDWFDNCILFKNVQDKYLFFVGTFK